MGHGKLSSNQDDASHIRLQGYKVRFIFGISTTSYLGFVGSGSPIILNPLYRVREFDELLDCLRLVSFDCISIPVFERFTQWYGKVNEEAVAYVQNHAFFEYACGTGKPVFLENHDCLSRAFTTQSLTQRINQCLPTNADMSMSAVQCVKDSLSLQCSPPAGSVACAAATNIALRAQEVSPICIQEMNLRCSTSSIFLWVLQTSDC
ncbi:unnamed protein product [Haemonchus placei]|uniref:Glycogen [starch] synthase n=1 Tax=Haemonchus placei TaxID=6290 RepID=A0A158QRT0_HAEPC|nr:unnamed protein product [Haemonchus placei]